MGILVRRLGDLPNLSVRIYGGELVASGSRERQEGKGVDERRVGGAEKKKKNVAFCAEMRAVGYYKNVEGIGPETAGPKIRRKHGHQDA